MSSTSDVYYPSQEKRAEIAKKGQAVINEVYEKRAAYIEEREENGRAGAEKRKEWRNAKRTETEMKMREYNRVYNETEGFTKQLPEPVVMTTSAKKKSKLKEKVKVPTRLTYSDEEKKRMIELYLNEGLSIAKVAREVDVSYVVVHRIIKDAQIIRDRSAAKMWANKHRNHGVFRAPIEAPGECFIDSKGNLVHRDSKDS